jgi:F0F1-type ATP synthase membrane subunit b/b'
MSAADRVRKDLNDSIKSAEEFIENTKKSLQKELSKTTPKIEHALDRPMDDAGQALSNALKTIDKKTSHEQMELLKGYRSFLQGQAAFVDKRIKAIKDE